MGAIVRRTTFERTWDVHEMLTSAALSQAIKKAVKRRFARQEQDSNILDALSAIAVTSTFVEYGKRARTAMIWNEGGTKKRIPLPFKEGWYELGKDGFGVPNGNQSRSTNPNAFFLNRYQNLGFNGPVGLRVCWDGFWRRDFLAVNFHSRNSGLALVSPEAAAPLAGVPEEQPVSIVDPGKLRQNAAQLRAMAYEFRELLGAPGLQELAEAVTPPLEEVARILIEAAQAIGQTGKK